MNNTVISDENGNLIMYSINKSDTVKIFAMIILGLGAFLSGILPMTISQHNRRRFPLLISVMLCLGAGVLLATALVHMLPDVRKYMSENAEIYFSGGFFIIYFIDEIIHYFFGEAIQHIHNESLGNQRRNSHSNRNHRNHYGTTGTTTTTAQTTDSETCALLSDNNHIHHEYSSCNTEVSNARICHVSHTEPCSNSMTGTLGLLCALSLHSFIEGLAIGIQDTKSKVLFLLGAVACHKFVMGFCLGLELLNANTTKKSQIIAVLVFSLGSACGIGAGMAFIDLPVYLAQSALPILQALAGGTLLYVTVCEVMPREKARWHQNSNRKSAGIIQFLSVSVGFIIMTIINYYLDDDA